MLTMIICSANESDRNAIERISKKYAPYYSAENWQFECYQKIEEAKEVLDDLNNLEYMSLDLTMLGAIPFAELVRKKFPSVTLLIIADGTLSPMTYLRPSIMASSLVLKPIQEMMLDAAIKELFEYSLETAAEESAQDYFMVESKDEKIRIRYSAVDFFESREKKIFLYAGSKEYGFYSTMENLDQSLPENFLRCHRGYILNVNHVKELRLTQNLIVMEDGSIIPISRSYRSSVKEALR